MSEIAVLLPVRIETRFAGGDLRIRIVPDEPWFVRDDPRISEDERLALRRYAAAPPDPAADGVPLAWRSLAGQVGAARAAFLTRRFITTGVDGGLAVRTPDPHETRHEPTLPRISGFPTELVVWIQNPRANPRAVLRLTVDRTRLLADFADPEVPGDRRWWEHWDEAVAVGVAGTVPASELGGAIEALYVTGLGDGDPGAHFAALASEGRMGLLEPGTPTNSVDGAPAAPLANDAATWWTLLQSPPGEGDRDVSLVLTGDPQLLGNMPGGDRPHRTTASALVTTMWPALWGFAAGQVFDLARGSAPAQWAGRALFPEGAYPTVRIGSQPYGVLPATAWRSWKRAAADPSFEAPLIDALSRVRDGHVDAARRRGTAIGQTTEGLLDLLSDTPTSSRFRFRHAWPLELWWLGMISSGVPQRWRSLVQAWSTRHTLADALDLSPVRRYGARGVSRRVGLPLVVPRGTRAEDVPAVLDRLAASAVENPAAFANTARLEADVLGLPGSSLLLRLAIRSLQLLIADVRRERTGVARADPEPFSRNNRQRGRLEELIRAVGPIDTTLPLTAATRHLVDVAAALRTLGSVPVRELQRMLAATIDCSNHRIDAWFVAPAQRRLSDLLEDAGTSRRLGAYGWVDGPAPGAPGPTAAGVVHAPSASTALAAAVLRDRAVNEGGNRWDLAITSRTARVAERLAQHVRVGADLTEALGREVERIVGKTEAVETLRRHFPVRTEHAGRRVCDGLRVLAETPFPVPVDAEQQRAIQELRDGLDTYGDLLVADAVHHLVEGRADVAAAVMNGAAGLSRPPDVSVLRTPRDGRAVSSSVVLLLSHVTPQPLPASDVERSLVRPSAVIDPSVAAFLVAEVGAASAWTFQVRVSHGSQAVQQRTVRLGELGLEPADALSLTRARLEALAIEQVAARLDLDSGAPDFTAAVIGGTAAAHYEQAARLVGLIGRTPAGARSLSDDVSAASPQREGMDAHLLGRYVAAREVAAALVRQVRAQVLLLGPDGAIGGADIDALQRLLVACARWGVAPDPPRRPTDAGTPAESAAERRRQRVIDGSVLSLPLLEHRLNASPDAAAAGQLGRDDFLRAAATLLSPTGQIALTGTMTANTLPALLPAFAEGELDAEWLAVVAAVRPALARLEAHQLSAAQPLRAWTNRPTDPWQQDAADRRRMTAIYAPAGLDVGSLPAAALVATSAVDRFSEVIPAAEMFTGAAFGFDAPASRAPQAILIAVPPVLSEPLDQETLVRMVSETRELAHARMARPVDLDRQFWGLAPTGLLPASGATAASLEERE